MQWSLEAMEKDLQQQYLDTESNSRLFFDTFFELCRKFNIQYSIATTQEKAFIDEVTESIYERKKAMEKPPHISRGYDDALPFVSISAIISILFV